MWDPFPQVIDLDTPEKSKVKREDLDLSPKQWKSKHPSLQTQLYLQPQSRWKSKRTSLQSQLYLQPQSRKKWRHA